MVLPPLFEWSWRFYQKSCSFQNKNFSLFSSFEKFIQLEQILLNQTRNDIFVQLRVNVAADLFQNQMIFFPVCQLLFVFVFLCTCCVRLVWMCALGLWYWHDCDINEEFLDFNCKILVFPSVPEVLLSCKHFSECVKQKNCPKWPVCRFKENCSILIHSDVCCAYVDVCFCFQGHFYQWKKIRNISERKHIHCDNNFSFNFVQCTNLTAEKKFRVSALYAMKFLVLQTSWENNGHSCSSFSFKYFRFRWQQRKLWICKVFACTYSRPLSACAQRSVAKCQCVRLGVIFQCQTENNIYSQVVSLLYF